MVLRRPRMLILLVVLVMAACSPGSVSSPGESTDVGPGLVGTAWRLIAFNGQAPPPGPDVTIRFDADRVSGDAPCNAYSGFFSQDPKRGRLVFGPLSSTKRACLDQARGALETAWFAALKGDLGVRLDGDDRLDLAALNATRLTLARVR